MMHGSYKSTIHEPHNGEKLARAFELSLGLLLFVGAAVLYLLPNQQGLNGNVVSGLVIAFVVGGGSLAYRSFRQVEVTKRPKLEIQVAGSGRKDMIGSLEDLDPNPESPRKLRIEVKSLNKYIRDAQVYCNETNYVWDGEGGSRTKNISVGEIPCSSFSPFTTSARWENPDSTRLLARRTPYLMIGNGTLDSIKGSISFKVFDAVSGELRWQRLVVYPVRTGLPGRSPIHSEDPMDGIPLKIRVTGEGIDEIHDYDLSLMLSELMTFELTLGQPELWRYRFRLTER